MRTYKIVFILLLLGLSSSLFAQQDRYRWRIGLSAGAMNYYGELESRLFPPNPLFSDWDTDYLSYGISLENTFSRSWSWKLAYSRGKFLGNDIRRNWNNEIQRDASNFERGLNAQTQINDLALLFTYFTDNGKLFGRKSFISPYFVFGFGINSYQVARDLQNAQGQSYFYWPSDQSIRDQPEGSPGAQIIEQDGRYESLVNGESSGELDQRTFNVQGGIGLKFRLGGRFNLNMEMMARQTFNDQLDNIEVGEWYDLYSYTSLSLHYNFARRENTFKAPKIRSSSQALSFGSLQRDTLDLKSLESFEIQKDSLDPSLEVLIDSSGVPTLVQNYQIYLRQDSLVVYQDSTILEAQNNYYYSEADEPEQGVFTNAYINDSTQVIKVDTLRVYQEEDEVLEDAVSNYQIQETRLRPVKQDTIQLVRYVRDTVVVKSPEVQLDPKYYFPQRDTVVVREYNYQPSRANQNRPQNSYQESTTSNYPYESPYNYNSSQNNPNSSYTGVITPVPYNGGGNQNQRADSTQIQEAQRLNRIEEKLDIIAWQFLKMQKNADSSRLDSTQNTAPVKDTLTSVPAQKLAETNPKNTEPSPEKKANQEEVQVLKQQIQGLETKLNQMQESLDERNIQPKTPKEKVKVADLTIQFATKVHTLSPKDKENLKQITSGRTGENIQYRLRGYSDKYGDPQQNLILSKMRADAVRNALMELGVKMDNIVTEFYGENLGQVSERKVEITVFEE